MEAALLGTPMVTFYKVTAASWMLGRMLVRVPFYSMVNLIAGRAVVPELMQSNLTGERLAAEAQRLLRDEGARGQMRTDLAEVAAQLSPPSPPMARASAIIQESWKDNSLMFSSCRTDLRPVVFATLAVICLFGATQAQERRATHSSRKLYHRRRSAAGHPSPDRHRRGALRSPG